MKVKPAQCESWTLDHLLDQVFSTEPVQSEGTEHESCAAASVTIAANEPQQVSVLFEL